MCTLHRMLQICDENGLVQKEVKDTYNREEAQKVFVICSFSALRAFVLFLVYNPGKPPKFLKLVLLPSV